MTNQQVEIILQAITKNRVAVERRVMEMEQKVCSKILTLEEELADIRMERTLPSKLCSIENDISNIRSELKDINSALLSNKTNASQDEINIPHAEDGGMAAKHPINSFQQLKVHTETPESTSVPRNIETDISNIRRELKDINSALLSNKIHASQDERNIPHAEDGGMAAKHPINSFQQSKVHTEMPESTPVAQSIENLQPSMKDRGSTGDRSMLASKTLLRKTGGRDIYAQHSLQYLYTNDKHINESIEYFDFKGDCVLTEEDKEALHFITHSYQYAVVVDIADILLTLKFLEPHVKDGWLLDVVFVPFNLWGCHWCLLVVNNTKKEIQILNSLAGVPHFRDEKKEITMVKNLQACIEAAVEAGFVTPTESIDLTAWERVPYTNIPQQNDRIKWTFSEERYVAGCCIQKTTNVEKHHTRSLSRKNFIWLQIQKLVHQMVKSA